MWYENYFQNDFKNDFKNYRCKYQKNNRSKGIERYEFDFFLTLPHEFQLILSWRIKPGICLEFEGVKNNSSNGLLYA